MAGSGGSSPPKAKTQLPSLDVTAAAAGDVQVSSELEEKAWAVADDDDAAANGLNPETLRGSNFERTKERRKGGLNFRTRCHDLRRYRWHGKIVYDRVTSFNSKVSVAKVAQKVLGDVKKSGQRKRLK